jgi:hypothetical protein
MSKKTDPCQRYWQKLFGQAKVSLLGASDAALKVQLFEVLQEFFDGSNAWQETLVVTVIPDTLNYPLYPVEGGRILRLFAVIDQNRVPQSATMPDIGTVRFTYPYTQTQPMAVMVVKTVTDPLACYPPYIPDWVLPTYGLALFHGLVGNMMMQPGASYSNPQQAMFHLQRFRDSIAHARVAMMKANTVGAQPWVFPQQFRTYGQRGGVSTFNVHPGGRA